MLSLLLIPEPKEQCCLVNIGDGEERRTQRQDGGESSRHWGLLVEVVWALWGMLKVAPVY